MENVFENRFMTGSLSFPVWGADITIEGYHAIVHKPLELEGAQVKSQIFEVVALVMAGLGREGETIVSIHQD